MILFLVTGTLWRQLHLVWAVHAKQHQIGRWLWVQAIELADAVSTLSSIHVHPAHSVYINAKCKNVIYFHTSFSTVNTSTYRWYFIEHGILLVFIEWHKEYCNSNHYEKTANDANNFVNVKVVGRWDYNWEKKCIWINAICSYNFKTKRIHVKHTVFFDFRRLGCSWYKFILRVAHVTRATAEIHFLRHWCVHAFCIVARIVREASLHFNHCFAWKSYQKHSI